jgi:hypothetical protein
MVAADIHGKNHRVEGRSELTCRSFSSTSPMEGWFDAPRAEPEPSWATVDG